MGVRRRVLVVDDEPALRRAICRVLERGGVESACAASGEEAMELLDAGPFDVVLSDYEMVGMNGVELTRAIRGTHPGVEIVGMSSRDEKAAFLSAGACGFLPKPFSNEALLDLVHGPGIVGAHAGPDRSDST